MNKFLLSTIVLFSIPYLVNGASLSAMPATQDVVLDDIFNISIQLDTQGAPVDGVDLVYLNYDPLFLEIQDSDPSQPGVQILAGSLMPLTIINSVDESLGRVTFSQISIGGVSYTGVGTLATISFKATKTGTTNLTFNFTPSVTTDSNVASAGTDVLSSINNGMYTIKPEEASSPTPPPTSGSGSSGSSGGGGGGGGGSSSSGGGVPSGWIGYGVPSFANTTIVSSPLFTTILNFATYSPDVKVLQQTLNTLGFIVSISGPGSKGYETDYFGPATRAALIKFQLSKNLPATGLFDNATRNLLNTLVPRRSQTTVASTAIPGCPAGFTCTPIAGIAGGSLAVGVPVSVPPVAPGSFFRNLTIGSTGSDVKTLQKYLNNNGFIIATSGAGSPGNETLFFGPATQAALIKFQLAKGIIPPAGFFGPITREHIK